MIYNIADNRFIAFIFGLYLPSISVSLAIFAPKLLTPLTLNHYKNPLLKLEDCKVDGNPNFIIDKSKYDPVKYVKIRILYPHKLVKSKNTSNALLYIHGGGFISLSSKSQQSCIRKWAKITNIVIYSVDYRLAPESSYPDALDDILNAYYWVAYHSEQVLGIPAEKIILSGDSAGGGLALSLGLRLMKSNFKKPSGLLIANPALNLSSQSFTPSYMFSLTDPILRHSMLLGVIQSYVGDGDAIHDPYLSPSEISDEDINIMPPVRMMIALKDPLCDEAIKLTLKFAYKYNKGSRKLI